MSVPGTVSIFISEDDPDFQFLFGVALSEIDPAVVPEFAHSAQELISALKERAAGQLPSMIVAVLRPPFFSISDLQKLKSDPRLSPIPAHIIAEAPSQLLRQKVMDAGAASVHAKPFDFKELKSIVGLVLKTLVTGQACVRCEDHIEHYPGYAPLKLSEAEKSFIASRFKGPLCLPCLNQLKTSYRILQGDYNVGSGARTGSHPEGKN